jgi:uncharacterized protein
MRIVIAGGRGFLGQALSARLLADSHQVLTLTRGGGASKPWDGARSTLAWTPDGTAGEWASALEGVAAVVNLAGESIAGGRWTTARKAEILDSRVLATRSLVAAIRGLRTPPAVFVSSSAQGYYGDRGEQELPEEAAAGTGFLADVCVRWEAEARAAEGAARVVTLRTGIVLSAESGALPRMLLPFRLGGGGPLGSGRQFMSWIHVDDWVGIAALALGNDRVSGPINLGSPAPVRNSEFAAALGRALHRPSLLPAPGFALRLALGEMAQPLLLASTRMVPARALAHAYRFSHDELGKALRSLLA